ncbi:MAG: MFS transporter [Acidimicrobiia bacterium]|nr:MFS transporter [Acidimicrobiia bacterium]
MDIEARAGTSPHVPGGLGTSDEATVPRRAWVGLGLGAAASLVVSLNVAGTNMAFPAIEEAFPDTSRSVLSWTISGYGIGLAAFLLVGGRVADRVGRRKVLLWSCACLLVASVLTAAAPTATTLIALRFVQSVAAAFALPASISVSLPEFPAAWRGRVVSLWSATSSMGAALGPSLAALAVEWASWRAVYLLGVPVLVVVLLVGPGVLSESRAPAGRERLDWLGVAMGTVAVAGVVFAVSQSSSFGWTNPWVLGALVLTAGLLPLFLRRCHAHPEPLLDLEVFKLRTVWSADLANLFFSMAGMSVWLVWPLFLIRVWGYSSLEAGLAISAGPGNALIWSVIAGRIVDRRGPRGLISIGSLMPLVATVWFVLFLGEEPDYLFGLLPGVLLFSTGFGLTSAPLNAAALAGVPDSAYGQVNAGFNTARYLAGAVGTAAVVAILGDSDEVAAFSRAYVLLAAFALLGAATVWLAYPRDVRI